MILISACLCGENCKYNGGNNKSDKVLAQFEGNELLKVCPEVLGGLSTPRVPAEIQGGTAQDVLEGRARIQTATGVDVTEAFIKGAQEVFALAQTYSIQKAVLKAKSPSCGKGVIYDGSFSGKRIVGNGVTTQLLLNSGIEVVTEEDYE